MKELLARSLALLNSFALVWCYSSRRPNVGNACSSQGPVLLPLLLPCSSKIRSCADLKPQMIDVEYFAISIDWDYFIQLTSQKHISPSIGCFPYLYAWQQGGQYHLLLLNLLLWPLAHSSSDLLLPEHGMANQEKYPSKDGSSAAYFNGFMRSCVKYCMLYW